MRTPLGSLEGVPLFDRSRPAVDAPPPERKLAPAGAEDPAARAGLPGLDKGVSARDSRVSISESGMFLHP